MRRILIPGSLEIGDDGKPNLQLEKDEVVIAIKEEEIIFAVDALRARAQQVSERQLRAWTVEGEDVHGDRVDALGWLEQGYSEVAGNLIFSSNHSWKSSDQRNPEKEAYEIAQARRAAFKSDNGTAESKG